MEIEHPNYQQPIIKAIVDECNPQVQLTFLQYLQTQLILSIALLAKKYKKSQYFYKLALVFVYFKSYLNRVDRTMYYLFYEEKEFTTLEQSFIINIANKSYNSFFQLRNSYEDLIANFQEQASCVSEQEELRNILQTIFFQTDYPLPVCKRQTIGVYCQTPFQQFVSLIRFPLISTPDEYVDPPLEEMSRYFLQESDMNKIIQNIQQQGPENISKLSLLRYCSHKLRDIQLSEIKIHGFQLHNIIAILFKLAAISAKASSIVIKEHSDPIMKMAQFVTRANIFKNMVLAIQEKFGFLFRAYGDIFQIITKGQHCPNLPKFQFWNGAMAIWVQQFESLNLEIYQSFNYILLRQRQINIIDYLNQRSQAFPSIYNPIKLELEEKSLFEEKKEEIYKNMTFSYQNFFQKNIDSYEILGKDFLQHQIDISINQFNVHKCGHSEHVIKRVPFFLNFIQTIKQNSNNFYSHLRKIIHKKNLDKKMRLGLMKDLIKFDLDFIEGKFTKPVILKEILTSAQQLMQSLTKKLPQFTVFAQQAIEKFGIHFDFSQKDNLLDYFCAKSETPNDCLAELRSFYDTLKEKTFEQMLVIAMSSKEQNSDIQSQIQDEFYESSLSNNSILSLQEQ